MKIKLNKSPREFTVKGATIKDQGKIFLEDLELVSFVTKDGRECDFSAENWGFYIGPSLNGRLKHEGFKTALILNTDRRLFIHAVAIDKLEEHKQYIKSQESTFICWLDEWGEPAY